MPERPRARVVQDLSQVVIVLFQCLLAHDDVPPTRKGAQHKALRPRCVQLEFNRMRVTHVDRTDGRKQRRAGATEPYRRRDDTGESRLDILCSESPAVMELHALAQEERIRLAIWRNLPAVCQVWKNGLPAVQGVASDQIVIHT